MSTQDTTVRQVETAAVLANAIEFGSCIIKSVVGNEVADGFDNEALQTEELQQLMGAKLTGYLRNPTVKGA